MALPTVIAKNQTGTPILLPRLGVTVPASPDQIDLTSDATFFEVASEAVLEQRVSVGDIVINDGTSDLSLAEALGYIDGSGNFNGPVGSPADNRLVRLDGSSGRYSKTTGITIDDDNNIIGMGSIDGTSDADQVTVEGTYTTIGAPDDLETVIGNIDTVLSNLVGDLPACQVRRSANLTVPTSWADIAFDTTDIENDTSIIEHDNTNTDRINIGENGLYLISFQASIDADSGEETFDMRVRVDDTTVLPGSLRQISEDDETNDIGNVFLADLTDGEYLSFQVQGSGTGNVLLAESTYLVVKLQGIKGDKGEKGDTGAGSTIIVEDEGATVPGGPHSTLNFVGSGVTASNAGSGEATITIPAASPTATVVEASSTITTTSGTHVLATGMTITPTAGTYMVWWSASVSTTGSNDFAFIQVYAGGSPQGVEQAFQQVGTFGGNNIGGLTAMAKVTVNGAQAIEGRWRQLGGTGQMYGRTLTIMEVT